MYQIEAKPNKVINIGNLGENKARQVVFDVKEWIEEYPTGIIFLKFRQSINSIPYDVNLFEIVEDKAYWTLTAKDTMTVGAGTCQLFLGVQTSETKYDIIKSLTFNTYLNDSVDDPHDMQPLTDTIYPGSTPLVFFYVNTDLSKLEEPYKLEITFSQYNRNLVVKRTNEIEIDTNENRLVTQLTRDDTLKFRPGTNLEIQMRIQFSTLDIIVSDMMIAKVGKALSTGDLL